MHTPSSDRFGTPPALRAVRALFPAQLHDRIFLVGGAVRDLLLGVAGNDLDLVAALPEPELLGRRFRLVAPKSAAPVYFRPLPDGSKAEITRIATVAELEDDLRRRDFTVNAIALGLDGTLRDPLGGRDDLAARTLRLAAPSAFAADPARIWRAFRFEAAGWRLDETATGVLRERDWNPALAALPVERFSQELIKALGGREPTRFFARMLEFECGRSVLPELFRMPQVPAGPPQHHPEGDLFTHCCQVLERLAPVAPEPLARFCAFFHDLGKLATAPALYPKHHGHDDAGAELAPAFCRRLALPAAWSKALACISRHHGTASRWDETRDATRIRVAEAALKAGVANLLPLVAAADFRAGPGLPDWDAALAAAQASGSDLGIPAEVMARQQPCERAGLVLHYRVNYLRKLREGGSEVAPPP